MKESVKETDKERIEKMRGWVEDSVRLIGEVVEENPATPFYDGIKFAYKEVKDKFEEIFGKKSK